MNNEISESVELGESVVFQTLGDETVLLNMSSQCYYGLDDVGSHMWAMLMQHRSMSDIVKETKAKFSGASDAVILADLQELVANLSAEGLLAAPAGKATFR